MDSCDYCHKKMPRSLLIEEDELGTGMCRACFKDADVFDRMWLHKQAIRYRLKARLATHRLAEMTLGRDELKQEMERNENQAYHG